MGCWYTWPITVTVRLQHCLATYHSKPSIFRSHSWGKNSETQPQMMGLFLKHHSLNPESYRHQSNKVRNDQQVPSRLMQNSDPWKTAGEAGQFQVSQEEVIHLEGTDSSHQGLFSPRHPLLPKYLPGWGKNDSLEYFYTPEGSICRLISQVLKVDPRMPQHCPASQRLESPMA